MEYNKDFIPDGMNAFERNVKRIGDCIIAGILLIIFSPLFISYRLLNHPIIYFDNSYFANNLINKELLYIKLLIY